jgi:hypothetical protein
MKETTVSVVKDFSPRPYGRTDSDGEFNGAAFRQRILIPALNDFEHVHVDLNGYNRYGRSFLDESFGGLIRENGYSLEELDQRLSYTHDLVKSIEAVIRDRLEAAERDRGR